MFFLEPSRSTRFHTLALLAVIILCLVVMSCEKPATRSAGWHHLSTVNNDLDVPGTSKQQTACLIEDINHDGLNDFVIGSRKEGASLVWYQRVRNGWSKRVIEPETLPIEAGGTSCDIDGDGDQDIVFGADSTGNDMWWWENPFPNFERPWKRRQIKSGGANKHHDQVCTDLDADGQAELAFWNQKAGTLFLADVPANPREVSPWPYTAVYSTTARSEGLAAADINSDGKVDLVGAGHWFEHLDDGSFQPHMIDESQTFTRVAVGQLKKGGWSEVVFVAGDGTGPLVWYEWDGSSWVGHQLLEEPVNHGHSLQIIDFNADRNLDILCGEMRLHGKNEDAGLLIFYGDGQGSFEKRVIAQGFGVHEAKAADLDGDGDVDILGKPYDWETPRLDIWMNQMDQKTRTSLDAWERHVIDDDRPWRSVFVTAEDVNQDGLKDAVTGGWWYENTGQEWVRHPIGDPLRNFAAAWDVDRDGDIDLLGTTGKGSSPSAEFVWAQNSGDGTFEIQHNISRARGDFLQGVFVRKPEGRVMPTRVFLSWHEAGKGIQSYLVPANPVSSVWEWSQVSGISQDEGLSGGDIDGDGDTDLLLGTVWLENLGDGWAEHRITDNAGKPDRNRLADLNRDGRLDAVVGYEAISRKGKLAWYEQGDQAKAVWQEHVIAEVVGPMSLDVADMDTDGDLDVICGEHNLKHSDKARLLVFENLGGKGTDWREHLVHQGDEHHDGAQVFDLDNDGDLDIVSIGWGHARVVWYEHKGAEWK